MFRVKDSMHVQAPVDRVFLLATSVPLVEKILGMRPIEGNARGLIQPQDRVLWRGWKFGLPTTHETLITGYERPMFFQDTQGKGRFRFFQHDHEFHEVDGQTLMLDVVRFSLPFGLLGRLVGKHFVAPYVLKLMGRRFLLLKRTAEGADWARWIAEAPESAAASNLSKRQASKS